MASAAAQGRQTKIHVSLFHFMDQADYDTAPGIADGYSHCRYDNRISFVHFSFSSGI
jgi:hypothetical protein